ncbi:hypothetical protein [Yinghuangia soli]|uniref:Uncharacterized protein n=1 Tax=Yinghuangia soli TaxID=2908204 RepID=A0AA41Q841_9ACTN|nr:hypothetical protein [Yinghuangia soli]MCF2533350.1 hypothetical protein [Yinghuangia soli]
MAIPVVTFANGIAALQGAAAGTPAAALATAYAGQLNALAGWPGGAPSIQQVHQHGLAEPKAHYVGGAATPRRPCGR